MHRLRIRGREKKFQAILKLDMKKAYNRIEWDFLKMSMLKMGFNVRWIELVMTCVSTVTFSVKVNGDQTRYFTPTRGLRQGDPLSPYLFILMANVFSWMMHKAIEDGSIKGIRLNKYCPTLSHLLFTDDAIIFMDGTVRECQNLANLLDQYCYTTGQVINLNKSGVFFFSKGCPLSLKRNMANELRLPIIDKTRKYLRILSDWGQTKKEMFS